MHDVQLAHYQQILELSERMLSAGLAQEWAELVRLEEQRQILLKSSPPFAADTPKIALAELIRKIQDSDDALREKVETWLKHARILLRLPPEEHTT